MKETSHIPNHCAVFCYDVKGIGFILARVGWSQQFCFWTRPLAANRKTIGMTMTIDHDHDHDDDDVTMMMMMAS